MIGTLWLKKQLQIFRFMNDFKMSIDLLRMLLSPSLSITKTSVLSVGYI
jgi:hypothetical protein